jgi:hypothetical protein
LIALFPGGRHAGYEFSNHARECARFATRAPELRSGASPGSLGNCNTLDRHAGERQNFKIKVEATAII